MKAFSLLLFKSLLILLLSLPVVLLVLAISPEPAAPKGAPLTESQIAGVQQLLIDNDPRLLLDEEEHTVILSEDEANTLLAYFIASSPRLERLSSHVELMPGTAVLDTSIQIPWTPFGGFVNARVSASQAGNILELAGLGLGAVDIPGPLADALLRRGRDYLRDTGNYRLLDTLLATVNGVYLLEDAMVVNLSWEADNLAEIGNQARRLLVNEEETNRLLFYHGRIREIAAAFPENHHAVTLAEFLRPLFESAAANTRAGADPAAENRALFITMTVYLTDLKLEDILGAGAGAYPDTRPLAVRVDSRIDLAQHIVSSAAIAASAGAGVADLLSVYKEVHDSRYRTGFSFSDVTANQVGAALGRLATAQTPYPTRLQDIMANVRADADYMPPVEAHDGLTEQEFLDRYGDRDSPQYRRRLGEVASAIAARPVFQALEESFQSPR